ncbi:uncharacterized protein LOC144159262 [Haemaphysalis longicornis]
MAAAFADPGVRLYPVRGFVSGVNWRQTKFAAPVPPRLTCGLCRVVSETTFLLPCFHNLCEPCFTGSVHNGNAVCPLDDGTSAAGDCQKFQSPPDAADKLKAFCWNEPHGCTFIGTLEAVLTHYEQQCTFHVVPCPRCNVPVLHQDVPRHYRSGCHYQSVEPISGQPRLHQGNVFTADEIAERVDELKALIMDPYHDRLPELQSKLNEVLEQARSIGGQVKEIGKAVANSEQTLAQAIQRQSSTFFFNLQRVESTLCDNQVSVTNAALNGSEQRLSDQLTQTRGWLSTTFIQELRIQLRELSTNLTNVLEDGGSGISGAGLAGASEMPWKREMKLILRKLELLTTDSHAHVQYLRQRADERLEEPATIYTHFVPTPYGCVRADISPFVGRLEDQEECYVVTLANFSNLRDSGKPLGKFTLWYARDGYLQVATKFAWADSSLTVKVRFKWGTFPQGSCLTPCITHVWVKHPEDCKEHVSMKRLSPGSESEPGRRGAFQEDFAVTLPSPTRTGFVKNGKLAFVFSFKTNGVDSLT